MLSLNVCSTNTCLPGWQCCRLPLQGVRQRLQQTCPVRYQALLHLLLEGGVTCPVNAPARAGLGGLARNSRATPRPCSSAAHLPNLVPHLPRECVEGVCVCECMSVSECMCVRVCVCVSACVCVCVCVSVEGVWRVCVCVCVEGVWSVCLRACMHVCGGCACVCACACASFGKCVRVSE
jgi:hypothetical protein